MEPDRRSRSAGILNDTLFDIIKSPNDCSADSSLRRLSPRIICKRGSSRCSMVTLYIKTYP